MNEIAKENDKFVQADELIKALHIMDNNELKFMFYTLANREHGNDYLCTTLKDVLEQLHLSDGGKQIKTYSKAIKSIIKKSYMEVTTTTDRLPKEEQERHEKAEEVLISGPLISKSHLFNNGEIEIKFNEDFLPLLEDLKHDFTWIYLEQVARLNGKYSPRFYEWCKMHLKNNESYKFKWYIEKGTKDAPSLREWLSIGNKYNTWRELKRRVIEPTVKEINEVTSDIKIEYEPVRGYDRSIIAIDVTLSAKHKAPIKEKTEVKKIKLDDKFYEQEETRSYEEIQEEIKRLQELLKNNEL